MTSVCDWCPRGISKEEKIHRGRPPPGETSRLLGNPLRQRRWRNLDSNYVENPCWFANSQGRERPEQVVRSGNFICWNLLWPGLGVHFAFFLPFFFFFGGRTTRERAPSLHFPIRRGELPGWARSAPQSGRRCEQRPGLPVQRQSWAPGCDGTEQQRGCQQARRAARWASQTLPVHAPQEKTAVECWTLGRQALGEDLT